MQPPDSTNADLTAFLSKKAQSENYRGAGDLAILTRERAKLGYFFAVYFMVACLGSYFVGQHAPRVFSPVSPLIVLGFFWLYRRQQKLDGFIMLLLTRRPPGAGKSN